MLALAATLSTSFLLGPARPPSMYRVRPASLFLSPGDTLFEAFEHAPSSDNLPSVVQQLESLHAPPAEGHLSLSETDDAYVVTASAPHVRASDLHVSVENGILTFSGESHVESEDSTFHSRFSRSMPLPANANSDVLSTRYEDGRAIVEVPKETTGSDESDVEALAAASPRMRRWLRANGYLDMNAMYKSSAELPAAGTECTNDETEAIATSSPRMKRWLRANGYLHKPTRDDQEFSA